MQTMSLFKKKFHGLFSISRAICGTVGVELYPLKPGGLTTGYTTEDNDDPLRESVSCDLRSL